MRLKKGIDDTTVKEVRNILRLKKEIDDTTAKDLRNLFRLKKKLKQLKIEHEKEDYHKSVRVGNF